MPTESLTMQGIAPSQGFSKYEPIQIQPPLEGRRSQEQHVNPMPNPQLALTNNVGLKQMVDTCKRAILILQNLDFPTSDDSWQLYISWYLFDKCNLKWKAYYDRSSNTFRVYTLHRPLSSNELQRLLAWKQVYISHHNNDRRSYH